MADPKGFMTTPRETPTRRPVDVRIQDWREVYEPQSFEHLQKQAGRCMDCGIPFCHSGCPLGNLIPEWNDLIWRGDKSEAINRLHATNNFPEFTGRLCPAPCETACVVGINRDAVTIKQVELRTIEEAFDAGDVKPLAPDRISGKTIAVIGSGPAGLAAAQQLTRAGHTVAVYERADKIGGLLRYGIPNFKLEKGIIDRRVKILEAEGIQFKVNVNVGVNFSVEELNKFDSIVLCGGATESRSLTTKGIDAKGVVQAMTFLTQQTKSLYGEEIQNKISAKGKNVIVIGGGDTGSDCVGTSNRQGAKSVTNFEIMSKPPVGRSASTPWPYWPLQLKTSSSHEEGCDRNWLINTKEFLTNEKGELVGLKTVEVSWKNIPGQRPELIEKEGSEKIWPCELALLALGFTGPEKTLSEQLGLEIDFRNNYKANHYQTNKPHIFTAGDMRRGQSLIVWAISEGREAARAVDIYLMGNSSLPTKGNGDLPNL